MLQSFLELRAILYRHNRLLMGTTPPHPAVCAALDEFGCPVDWHHLTLEEPVEKEGRITYFRNDEKRRLYQETGSTNHRVVTSAERYLARHWPNIEDHRIRNLAGRFKHDFKFLTDIEEIVEAVINCQSYSCMKNHSNASHPYRVYDPKFGWKLAIQMQDGDIVGRALVHEPTKTFVRTYGPADSRGYTQSSETLHGWLEAQGYNFEDEWPEGVKFAKIRYKGEHLAPYLDPGSDRIASDNSRRVTDAGDYFVRSDDGEWVWENTDGTPSRPEDDEDYIICDDCGDRVHIDDATCTGYHEDHCVCSSCIDDYTYVLGRRGSRYYVPNDEAVCVYETYYDVDYLEDYGIVELHDGDYAKLDDTVYVESEDEYYLCSDVASGPDVDGLVVEIDDEYCLRYSAVWCVNREEWIFEEDGKLVGEDTYVHEDDWDEYIAAMTLEEVQALKIPQSLLHEAIDTWKEENLQEELVF